LGGKLGYKCNKKIWSKIKPGLKLGLKNLVFYDNNLFYNPYIRDILNQLIQLKNQKKIGWCESQSGFDGRILLENPDLAILMKKAGFRYPRIAWDWSYNQWPEIEQQIEILKEAGYNSMDIYVFIIYNWDFDFLEMEKKRIKCWEWNVQISDCRNRPLTQLYDHYKPLIDQSDRKGYYIHSNWTDAEVKQFRKNVRRQNICVRQRVPYHSKLLETTKNYTKDEFLMFKTMSIKEVIYYLPDLWIPSEITPPINREKWIVKKIIKPIEKPLINPIIQTPNQTVDLLVAKL